MYDIIGISIFVAFFLYGLVGVIYDNLTHSKALSDNALLKTRKAEAIVKHGEIPSPF